MKNNKCIKCGEEKKITDFYKHKEMKDGFLNKCKECCKKESRINHVKKTSTKEGLEKERKRCREKYKRLNYKERQGKWDLKKPWKKYSKYKNLSRKIKHPKTTELHHWSYLYENIEDVVIMNKKDHRNLHLNMMLDFDKRCFITKEGELLDSKEAHLKYIRFLGLNYILI